MSEQAENRALRGAQRRIGAAFLLAAFATIPPSSEALAQASPAAGTSYLHALASLERHEVASLALTLGILVFAVVVSIAYLRTRMRASGALDQARGDIARLKDELDRANAIILSEPQVIVAWREKEAEPLILGDAAKLTGQAAARRLLAFGTWLEPGAAREMEAALDSLRRRGEAFSRVLRSRDSRHVEIEGRPIAGAAVLRLRELTGARLDHATLSESFSQLESEVEEMRALLAAVPAPIWIRDAEGRLVFANHAYALAVEARDANDAVTCGLELLDRSAREEALRARAEGRTFAKRLPAVVAGQRRMLDVVEVSGTRGAAGVGIDATEAETIRAELTRVVAAHRRTLDQLATAVAIFGADERLVFYNAAYRALFQLDPAFLDERPTDSAILDRLRTERLLPEQADFRAWKAQLLEAYRAVEPKEHRWYLPGGRALRVVTNPNPEHGVTYLFDDISERIELESRFNALNRTQSETLEALTEAVAVFGTDGRLKLHNPVFAQMWKLSPQALATRPHIDTVAGWARALLGRRLGGEEALGAIKLAVTALEHRTPVERRVERVDGSVLDCAALPLPDGDTLVTFRDVSDSVNVERALVERNEALIAADALKSAFVHHVSYELRSPLTTIIGFAQLLDDPVIGPLNTKQREYVGHITESSAALLAIINDILDLATIDAGAMQLEISDVDVRQTMQAAAEGIRDRLAEQNLKLDIRVRPDIGALRADAKRVRQILFNLLSNAVGFSPRGGTITLAAERRDGAVIFRVADKGPGVPPELMERVFGRFETHTRGSKHRGPGLGLSIVRSFVALHGGSVAIDNAPGGGAVVTCIFPPAAEADHKAAE
jgi:signal transduction histidine kinase